MYDPVYLGDTPHTVGVLHPRTVFVTTYMYVGSRGGRGERRREEKGGEENRGGKGREGKGRGEEERGHVGEELGSMSPHIVSEYTYMSHIHTCTCKRFEEHRRIK